MLNIVAICLVVTNALLVSADDCPVACRCSYTTDDNDVDKVIDGEHGLYRVDCSNLALDSIPNVKSIPVNTGILLLSNNNIREIHQLQSLSLTRLRVLDLSLNPIHHVPMRVFHRLGSLTDLYVSSSYISEYALDNLLQLETLSITSSYINGHQVLRTLPTNLFDRLSRRLKWLTIRDTGIRQLSPNFLSNFECLQVVDISGNQISEITHSMFVNTTNLWKLTLSYNSLTRVDMAEQGRLSHLDLSHNRIACLMLTEPAKSLKSLRLQYNNLTVFPEGIIARLNDSLTYLDLSDNPWTIMPNNDINLLTRITTLKLRNLSSVMLDLSDMKQRNLEHIDLSMNCQLKGYALPLGTSIKHLNFSHSCLESFPFLHQSHGIIRELDIHGNEIVNLTLVRPIKTLNASHNNINFVNISSQWTEVDNLDVGHNNISQTADVHINTNTYLKNINFTFNKVKTLASFYTAPTAMQDPYAYVTRKVEIDFSYNLISNITEDAFDGIPSLVTLKLNNNNISLLPKNIFSKQSHLTKLDLNENNIVDLQQVPVLDLRHLSHLLLAGNKIRNLSGLNLDLVPDLRSLEISQNPFLELPEHFLQRNSKFKRLYINNSSLLCTCSLRSALCDLLASRTGLNLKGNCLAIPSATRQSRQQQQQQQLTTFLTTSACPWLQCSSSTENCSSFNCTCTNSDIDNQTPFTNREGKTIQWFLINPWSSLSKFTVEKTFKNLSFCTSIRKCKQTLDSSNQTKNCYKVNARCTRICSRGDNDSSPAVNFQCSSLTKISEKFCSRTNKSSTKTISTTTTTLATAVSTTQPNNNTSSSSTTPTTPTTVAMHQNTTVDSATSTTGTTPTIGTTGTTTVATESSSSISLQASMKLNIILGVTLAVVFLVLVGVILKWKCKSCRDDKKIAKVDEYVLTQFEGVDEVHYY